MPRSSEIVTGDAVLLEVRPARVPSRMLSALVDLTIVILANVLWNRVLYAAIELDTSTAGLNAIDLIGYVLISLGYPIVTETLTKGRTVGALAVGLRVTRDDGGVIRFRHALIRWVTFWAFDIAPWTAFLGGIICASLHPQGKRLGDLLAGTIVIRTRAPRSPAEIPPVPADLQDWASRVELTQVPQDVLTAARHFVQRRHGLLKYPRASIAQDLAAQIFARADPAPPRPLSPEEYLAVIVAERRRRETERITNRQRQWVPAADELPAGWR